MSSNNDPRKDGWKEGGENNGLHYHPDRHQKAEFDQDYAGNLLVRQTGAYNGWEKYDSEKHGKPNK